MITIRLSAVAAACAGLARPAPPVFGCPAQERIAEEIMRRHGAVWITARRVGLSTATRRAVGLPSAA